MVYCHTIIRPAFCLICRQSDKLLPSERMKYWDRDTDAVKHMFQAHSLPWHCLDCDIYIDSNTSARFHLKDNHGYTISTKDRAMTSTRINTPKSPEPSDNDQVLDLERRRPAGLHDKWSSKPYPNIVNDPVSWSPSDIWNGLDYDVPQVSSPDSCSSTFDDLVFWPSTDMSGPGEEQSSKMSSTDLHSDLTSWPSSVEPESNKRQHLTEPTLKGVSTTASPPRQIKIVTKAARKTIRIRLIGKYSSRGT